MPENISAYLCEKYTCYLISGYFKNARFCSIYCSKMNNLIPYCNHCNDSMVYWNSEIVKHYIMQQILFL
jgi:hypothetical protein